MKILKNDSEGLERNRIDDSQLHIGLLGGSFNPPHSGHIRISELALKILGLDQVWWLVSPHNPLKEQDVLAPFNERLLQSKQITEDHPHIRVSDLEQKIGTVYTVETIQSLLQQYKNTRFVWIMGADNLAQLHLWKNWQDLFSKIVVAVFDRPTYSFQALEGPAAQKFAFARIKREDALGIATLTPPAWVFLWSAFDSSSSSRIREHD